MEKIKMDMSEASYDPIKTIEMEGEMFRNMGHTQKQRSTYVRLAIIFFSLLIFVVPGLTIFTILAVAISRDLISIFRLNGAVVVFGILISILYTACGIKAIYNNLSLSKK
jgi:small neutral amino acid transporter SnatA (MarC family)